MSWDGRVVKRLVDHVAGPTNRRYNPENTGETLAIAELRVYDGLAVLRKPA